MRLAINESCYLSEIDTKGAADQAAIVTHLQAREIHDQTLRIPYPYTTADAVAWFAMIDAETERLGRPVTWAIRANDGSLLGCIGLTGLGPGQNHRAELGYWLGKPYWGKGLMTAVVSGLTTYAFQEIGLVRVEALVFPFNRGSARVLEKSGFQLEGTLRHYYVKNGRKIDALCYAKLP